MSPSLSTQLKQFFALLAYFSLFFFPFELQAQSTFLISSETQAPPTLQKIETEAVLDDELEQNLICLSPKQQQDLSAKDYKVVKRAFNFRQSKYKICYSEEDKRHFKRALLQIKYLDRQIFTNERLFKLNQRLTDQASFHFRLAELYAEKATLLSQYVPKLQLGKKPLSLVYALFPDFKKATEHYHKLLLNYQSYENYDQALYRSAFLFELIGDPQLAAELRLKLYSRSPYSEFRTENLFRLGDFYFSHDLFEQAQRMFGEALIDDSYPQKPRLWNRYAYSVLLNNDYKSALQNFSDLIHQGEKAENQSKEQIRSYQHVRELAFTGIVRSMARLDQPTQRLLDFFGGIHSDLVEPQLAVLAQTLKQIPKKRAAIKAYQTLTQAYQQSPAFEAYASELMSLVFFFKEAQQIYDFTLVLMKQYQVRSSQVASKVPVLSTEKIDKSASNTISDTTRKSQRTLLLESAMKLEEVAEKDDHSKEKLKAFTFAQDLYQRLIDFEAEDSQEKNFAMMRMAELSAYDFQQWQQAVDYYLKYASKTENRNDIKGSIYKAILAAEELVASESGKTSPQHFANIGETDDQNETDQSVISFDQLNQDSEETIIQRRELSSSETQLIQIARQYLRLFPNDNESPVIAYKVAQIFVDAGQHQEGITELQAIIQSYPQHKFASFSVGLLLKTLATIKEWTEVERWAREMIKLENTQVYSRTQLVNMILISRNTRASEMINRLDQEEGELQREPREKEIQIMEALNLLTQFQEEFPNHPRAVTLMANMAAISQGLSSPSTAVGLYEQLIEQFPNSSEADEGRFALANLYLIQTRFELSASLFRAFANESNHKKEQANSIKERRERALIEAISIYKALNKIDLAVQCLNEMIKMKSQVEEPNTLLYEIASLYERKKQWRKAREIYQKLDQKFKSKHPERRVSLALKIAQIVDLEFKTKGSAAAKLYLDRGVKQYKALPSKLKKRVVSDYAELLFLLAEYKYRLFEDFKITSYPQSKLQASLVKYATLQQEAEKAYRSIFSLEVIEVNLKSLVRFADMYYLFATKLNTLPIPHEIKGNDELIDAYRLFIEEQILPLEEKSIGSAQTALKLAKKFKVYNQWTQHAVKRLLQLQPESYPINGNQVLNTDWIAPCVDVSGLETRLKIQESIPEKSTN